MNNNANNINNDVKRLHDRAIQRPLLEQNLESSSSFHIKYQEEIYKRQFREIYVRKEQILSQWQIQRPAIQQFDLSSTYCPMSFVSTWWKSRVKSRRYPIYFANW